jgi:hypothetical protein
VQLILASAHINKKTKKKNSPLNISATLEDISHALQIVQPTHVATIPAKLDLVQAALTSRSMTKTKVLTVLGKLENFPQVSGPCLSAYELLIALRFIDMPVVPR